MKRRNFLKALSSIPLIGIPVKALAKPGITMKNGSTITFTESSGETYVGSPHSDEYLMTDPYADVAEHIYKEYWKRKS